MFRLLQPTCFKIREKASVFQAELHPASSLSTRTEILDKLKKRHFDATHHCTAWREGIPVKSFGADDDGEPSGTAGAPMLKVLEGADLTDVLAVCIRWFGGTKLGTGGLVRAYTESLQGSLAEAKAQGLLESLRVMRQGTMHTTLGESHLPYRVLGCYPEALVLGQDFLENRAALHFQVPTELSHQLEALWQEKTRGGFITWSE